MNPTGTNPYLRTKILTASPEELRLMLFDGAIRFSRQGQAALQKSDFENAYGSLMRAQKIVLELSSSLNHSIDPKLCERLAALYTYIYRILVDANIDRTPDKIDEAVKLLQYERETWVMLMTKNGAPAPGSTPGSAPGNRPKPDAASIAGAQQTAMSTYSRSA